MLKCVRSNSSSRLLRIVQIIAGRINPPLEGVTVKIFGNEKVVPIHTLDTQEDGTYRIGPLDGRVEYRYTRVIPYIFSISFVYNSSLFVYQRYCGERRICDQWA